MVLPIIGMSPGNSFFKDKEVAFLLRESIKKFGTCAIMVADVPAISTYLAMGYTMGKARSKAILKGNNLKNRIRRVLTEMGFDDSLVMIIDRANDVEPDLLYQESYKKIKSLYESNNAFGQAVRATSDAVLQGSQKDYSQAGLEQATHYLLSEIAFLEYAPSFFDQEKVTYVYHKNRRVYEDYVAGVFDDSIKHHLDFYLMEAPNDMYFSLVSRPHDRLEKIQQSSVIHCQFMPYFHKFFVVENNENQPTFSGKFYDVIQHVAHHNNRSVNFVGQVGYGAIAPKLTDGSADVFCSPIWPTAKRRQEMFFSDSLAESHIYAYLNKDSSFASKSLHDLQSEKNLRIAVKENDIHHEIALEYFPNARLVRVPQLSNIESVIEFVLDARADMTFWEDEMTEQFLLQRGLPTTALLKKSFEKDTPIKIYENCFAFPWGEFGLKKVFDKEIQNLSS